jgi:hypothetical protein
MGSTLCVRCGAHLNAHSYCGICHEIICYTCSECSLTTDERIHLDCQHIDTVNNTNNLPSQEKQRYLNSLPIRSAHAITETYYTSQNQLNDEMKYTFWTQVSNISINNSLKNSSVRDFI